jgi:acetate---CoA ligase (ADP-forming)
MADSARLGRLLNPRSIAVVGGRAAEVVVAQSLAIGYAGEIWPVNPHRPQLAGVTCYQDLTQLPGVPDAAFVSVNREASIGVVQARRRRSGLSRLGVRRGR